MMRLLRAPLRTRFILGMGLMLLPLVVLAGSAVSSLQTVIHAIDEIVQETSEEMALTARLQFLIRQARIVAHDSFIPGFGQEDERQRFLELSEQVDRAFQMTNIEGFGLAAERTLIQSAREEWVRARLIADVLLAASRASNSTNAIRQLERFDAHMDRALNHLNQVHNLALGEMSRHLERAREVRWGAFLVIALVFVVGLGTAILVGLLLARSVLVPLQALRRAATRFGSGDLSHRVSSAAQDELGDLAATFNVMAGRLAKVQAELEDLSIHDGLTGLYNFREFHRQLAEEAERSWRYGHSLSLLMLDIDHFKSVNDSFGHLAGDEVLRALAARVRQECRPADRMARYGGEEFTILLPETGASGALAMAERIREILAKYAISLVPGSTVNLTVSIGVAAYPEDSDSAEKLIGAADQALYAAKQAGRNRVCRFGKG